MEPPIDYSRYPGMDALRRLQNRGASRRASGSIGPGGNLGPSSLSDRNGSRRSNLGPPSTHTNTPLVAKKDEEANTDIARGPPHMPKSHSLKADSASFVSMADSAEMSPYANPTSLQAYLTKKALQDEMLELSLEDDAPPNSNAHRAGLSGSSNIGESPSFGSTSAPGASRTEQKPASMSDVLAYLSNIQQGIASIDKGMIGIQREIASVKEQVKALPGIFAVLPEFIGREVVSHVQDELLEPLGQRISDLEQRFTSLQTAEEEDPTEEVSLLESAKAAATCDQNNMYIPDGGSRGALILPYAVAGGHTLATEPSDFDGSFSGAVPVTLEDPSFSDAQDGQYYDSENFPYSPNNCGGMGLLDITAGMR
ncbi:hypothetical protein LTR17_004753 [Elasticomyces elasticus]|nr:hypothetical protein LTR17_004753 [Elasticomyces elasticus]